MNHPSTGCTKRPVEEKLVKSITGFFLVHLVLQSALKPNPVNQVFSILAYPPFLCSLLGFSPD